MVTKSVSRVHVLRIGQLLTCVSAIIIATLAYFGMVRPWHLGVSSFVSGMVWSTEMATRRRMVGESVEGHLISRALALDTMSNSGARLVGPIAAGIIYQHFGITGSFAVSACVYQSHASGRAAAHHVLQPPALLFYAAAALSQHVLDELNALASRPAANGCS